MKLFSGFFILLICLSFFSASSISLPNEIPMIISGQAYINDKPAGEGTEITARVNGTEVDKAIVEDEGRFAFALQGLNIGDKIDFYVDGIYADGDNETLYYHGTDFQKLTLRVEKTNLAYYILGGALLLIIIYILVNTNRFKNK